MAGFPERIGPITHGDCLLPSKLYPDNISALPDVASCQTSANVPYCWPPNGSRICVDVYNLIPDITVFWPQGYYHSDSKLQIVFDPTTTVRTDVINDGKDTTVTVSWREYDEDGIAIPGVEHEKAVNMYFVEDRAKKSDDPSIGSSNGVLHRGPTLILVQTEDWKPLSTARSTGSTNTTAAYPFADEASAATVIRSSRIARSFLGLSLFALTVFCGCA